MCAADPRIGWHDHLGDLPARMADADLVVAMAGYNTSFEIVAAGARAVLVPRTWKSGEHPARQDGRRVDNEQLLRAAALERLGLVHVLDPQELSPGRLAAAMREALSDPRPAPAGSLPLDGADRVAEELLDLAREAVRAR
jgi:predicted glycosyltransferase